MYISSTIELDDREIDLIAIRAQGPGGQNVNKVSSAIHLRFDIRRSSLPDDVKERLLQCADQRISSDGIVVIKAQQGRSQEQNRLDALQRLQTLIQGAAIVPKVRRATRPTRSSQRKRLETKSVRGQTKSLRGKIAL